MLKMDAAASEAGGYGSVLVDFTESSVPFLSFLLLITFISLNADSLTFICYLRQSGKTNV